MAESDDAAARDAASSVDRLAAALERIAAAKPALPPAPIDDKVAVGGLDENARARSLEVAARLDVLIAELRAVLGGS